MNFLVYNFRWLNRNYVEIQASINGRFARKQLKIGDPLSFEIKENLQCAGNMANNGEWVKCPQHATGKAKCDICKSIEQKGSFVYTVFDGFNTEQLSPAELERINCPHVVYLALFSENLIKIGVSMLERKELRQIEQGSLSTLYIAQTDDGTQARKIETLIRKSGLIDKVLSSQKKELFNPNLTAEDTEKILRNTFDKHKIAIDEHPALTPFLLETPEFICWEDVYKLSVIKKSKKQLHPVSLSPEESVSGILVAWKGPYLVIETPEDLVQISGKNLVGYGVNFSPKEDGLILKTALQGSLF